MKMKYCKHCGGALDYDKQCTECGKQYFRFNKSAFAILILSIALTCSVSFGFIKIYKLQHEIGICETSISRKKNKISSLEAEIEELKEKNNDLQGKANFLDNYIVFVVDNGEKYHSYNCTHFKNCKTYWAYNIEAAKSKGYEPCKVCRNK